jgi:HEAT repeat protein
MRLVPFFIFDLNHKIPVIKIFCCMIMLAQSSCMLLLLTDPDEEALKYNKNTIPRNCSSCGNKSAPQRNKASYRNLNRAKIRNSVSSYINDLSSESDVTRVNAATLLGYLDEHAIDAVPYLEKTALNDPSKWVRRASVKSLSRIGAESSLRVFNLAQKDKDPYVKMSAEKAASSWHRRAKLH